MQCPEMKGVSSAASIFSLLFWVMCGGAGALQTIPGPNATTDTLIQYSDLGLGKRNLTIGCGKNTSICQALCELCDALPSRMECYISIHETRCAYNFHLAMESLKDTHKCMWNDVKSPYNTFTLCSEDMADCLQIPWPNKLVEESFVYIHSIYFSDCPLEDAPPNIIFILVMTPICLIPVMVILVMLKTSSW